MTLDDVKQILTVLRVSYPQSFKNWGKEQAEMYMSLWFEAFRDESVEEVTIAVKSIIYSDIREFAPNIAQVKEQILKNRNHNQLDSNDAWNMVYDALKNSGYDSKKEFEKLPKEIQKMVGSHKVLKDWSTMNIDQLNTVIASNFKKSYSRRIDEYKSFEKLPNDVKKMIENSINLIE